MLDERLVWLTLLLNTAGSAHYIAGILRGQVRPNRASWLLWTIAPAVVLAAEVREGVGLRALMTLGMVLGPLLVVIASFTTRSAYWRLGRLDAACGALSGLAVALWAVTGSPVVAVVLSIAADALAAVPTIRKAITHPDTEDPAFFDYVSLGGVLTLLTVQRWTFVDWAFPAYIALFPGALAVLIRRRQVRRRTSARAGASGRPRPPHWSGT